MSKYGHRPHDWFEAIVNKLGGEEGAEAFLRDELTIKPTEHILATIPGFKPAYFFGKGWKVIKAESDHRAAALTSVNFAEVSCETFLKKGESNITGEEKLKRLKESGKIRLGAETFFALRQEDDYKTLEWLYKEKGVSCLDFFGTVLRSSNGSRYVFFLVRSSRGRWEWGYSWLGHNWDGGKFSAFLAS